MTAINFNQAEQLGGHAPFHGMRRKLAGAVLVAALLLPATFGIAFLVRAAAVPAPQVEISSAVRMQIPTMSTGAHQALVVTGDTAQERNAYIPLAGGTLADMRGFAEIRLGTPQYATALKCLTQAVYYEAANEPELGKRAVAQVVLNRVRHPAYPNTVCGVVYEGANAAVCQFSFTCDGSLLRPPLARQWAESRRVAEAALAGSVVPEVGSATNYHADYVLPGWAYTLGKLRQIGAHIFYRLPGRIGNAAAFADHWAGFERIPALDFDRLRRNLAAAEGAATALPEEDFVPGLTVTPDIKDRHAAEDVGGRLDTTTGWRLSIPDTVQLSASYRSALTEQDDGARQGTSQLAYSGSDERLEP